MQLSASIRVYESNDTWILESKLETPILNFDPDFSITTLKNDVPTDSVTPRGMWHQYGRKPTQNEGVFLKISDIPNLYKKYGSRSSVRVSGTVYNDANLTGSLFTDILKFDGNKTIKLGKVKEQKIISEAIVCIPFIIKNNKREFFTVPYHYQVPEFVKFENGNGSWASDETKKNFQDCLSHINKQRDFMNRYAIPPHLNWLSYNVPQYLMFFNEFNHQLNEQDLIDMWQNILPTIGTNNNWKINNIVLKDIPIQIFNDRQPNYVSEPIIEQQTVNAGRTSMGGIETGLNQVRDVVVGTRDTEYIIGDSALIDYSMLNDVANLQWLTFKVKKQSKSYYDNVSAPQETGGFGGGGGGSSVAVPKYHNWPYDYYSLVESARIKIKYKN
jgi:hypothetical protein